MACDRHREALSDLAAGGSAPPETVAHLATCVACRDELERLRGALLLADQELAAVLLVEPPPSLAPRIRGAASEVEVRSPWRWGLAGLAAAVAAVVAFGLLPETFRAPEREARNGHATSPAPSGTGASPSPDDLARGHEAGGAPVPDAAPPVRPMDVARSTRDEGRAGGARLASAPSAVGLEVLVPPGETESLLRFAAQLQDRVVSPDSILVRDLSEALTEPKELDIQPLSIAPLDPAESAGTD